VGKTIGKRLIWCSRDLGSPLSRHKSDVVNYILLKLCGYSCFVQKLLYPYTFGLLDLYRRIWLIIRTRRRGVFFAPDIVVLTWRQT